MKFEGTLGLINFYKSELVNSRNNIKTVIESERVERNIAGYDMILATKSEANAVAFMVAKSNAKPRFNDNMAVIESLKKTGRWSGAVVGSSRNSF